jgi:hypothetical protein
MTQEKRKQQKKQKPADEDHKLRVDFNWKGKYSSLRDFYRANFDSKFYEFEPVEYEIDPMETIEQIESYSKERQQEEIKRCAESFNYFCHKYVKISHPKIGLLPFITFKYQRRCIEEYEDYRFNLIKKFRQGGLTTVTGIWCMWRCLFRLDETIMIVSKTDREAIAAGEIVKRALDELPQWMQPDLSKNNDHQKIFDDTGCKLFFYTPEAARGRSITYLIIDEAAFVKNMHTFWNGIFPTVATGGSVIAVSTVNGVGNWYYEMYDEAMRGENDFNIIDIEYTEHPEYDDEKWVQSMRAQLGEKGFQQEILADFHNSGESFIPTKITVDINLQTKKIFPIRTLFEEYANKNKARKGSPVDEGALLIWREPIEGRDYIIGVDAAAGIGGDGDNSCFCVIDAHNLEQVAEFYSNTVKPFIFAEIIASAGSMYNTALVIVENEKDGMTVLSHLQHDCAYENLFYQNNDKAGIKTTKASKPMLLNSLQTRLITGTATVRSRRLSHEITHFIYDPVTQKATAPKGYHDDAIMAMSLALFARDLQVRQIPIGAGDINLELTERYKTEVYEQIKEELLKGAAEDWLMKNDEDGDEDDYLKPSKYTRQKRSHDALLREFNW